MLYSKLVNPVVLLSAATGFGRNRRRPDRMTFTNTIGMVPVACCTGATVTLPIVMITSGVSAISSAAWRRMEAASPPAEATSICRFWPTVQPNCWRLC